jgi:hypothetical protein
VFGSSGYPVIHNGIVVPMSLLPWFLLYTCRECLLVSATMWNGLRAMQVDHHHQIKDSYQGLQGYYK